MSWRWRKQCRRRKPQGYTCAQVQYHIDLCEQAGYLVTNQGYPVALTWAGHEALETMG